MYSSAERIAYLIMDLVFKPIFFPDFKSVIRCLNQFDNMDGQELETAKKVAQLLYEEWNRGENHD
jgi:hypothetical protein